MRVQTLIYFYGRRLRTHPIQELLAGLGIAIGVALAFAVLVANGSIASSANEVVRAVVGRADLQLQARDTRGFDASVLSEVERLPGVRQAAPLVEQRAVLIGPSGERVAVNLGSLDPRLAALSGRLAGNFVAGGFRFLNGVMLPSATAQALGLPNPVDQAILRPLPPVRVVLRGAVDRLPVAAVLGRETIGPVSSARVGMLPLRRLQQLAGMEGRLTRVLVETIPGQETQARAGLAAVARRHHLALTPTTAEAGLLEQALGPSNQATSFFAAISALLGLLLAFNAMLLTAPERRRMLAELRIQGFKPRQLIGLLLFQAFVLGAVASLVGLVVGSVLSHSVFNASPDYLSPAFTLGASTVVGAWPIALAFGGGTLACCLAAAPPLLDLRRGRAVDAVFHAGGAPGNALELHTRRQLFAVALVLIALATALLLAAPWAALVSCGLLALATVLAIPLVFSGIVKLAEALTARFDWLNMLSVALLGLRATTVRSLALAATGAVAVFGSVAIGGARNDLLNGISGYTDDYVSTADLWVVNPADNQATNDIAGGGAAAARAAAVPGVAAVRPYQGGFLDFNGRRVWVIARSPEDRALVPASQLVRGDVASATRRLREGGWVVMSDQVARAHHVGLGSSIVIPTPTGTTRLRVAATTTNLGWPPGAIIMAAADYRRAWATAAPTALEVDFVPGADQAAVQRGVAQAVGAGASSGLLVQTADARAAGIDASAGQGLARLGQISALLLIAAVLAMAAAMGAAIWQRRASLAALRIQSFSPRQLWRVLLLETSVVLGAGCLTGALVGIYGQVVIDRYLRSVTGFPVASTLAGWSTVEIVALVVVAALAVVAIPGWFAARVPPQLGLQDY
ncbi:MAG TPA: FtsX-like permease family protein [Conexibacter sp.]|jgi:putative ABC transport system permease protein|nr:FtsX-like permease family protein [Conexibacter sp.]